MIQIFNSVGDHGWMKQTASTDKGVPSLTKFVGRMYIERCRSICSCGIQFTQAVIDRDGFCFCGDQTIPLNPGLCQGTEVVIYPDGSCRGVKESRVQVSWYINLAFWTERFRPKIDRRMLHYKNKISHTYCTYCRLRT